MDHYLPPDLTTEILRRLPVRARVRFQCVCKLWCFLISEIPLKRIPTLLICTYPYRALVEHPVPHTVRLSSYDTKGNLLYQFDRFFQSYVSLPTTGLLDFVLFRDFNFEKDTSTLFLCNPTTKEFIQLPSNWRINIPLPVGLGYVSSTKELKVLCFTDYDKCKVFTVGKDHSWKVAQEPPFFVDTSDVLVCANGAINLLNMEQVSRKSKIVICAFDLKLEEWGLLPTLNIKNEVPRYHVTVLCEFLECPCLMVAFDDSIGQTMKLWLFRDLEWIKEYNITVAPIVRSDCQIPIVHVQPFAIDDDGSLLVYEIIGKKAFIVNCSSGWAIEIQADLSSQCWSTVYLESISSFKDNNRIRNRGRGELRIRNRGIGELWSVLNSQLKNYFRRIQRD